MRYEFKPSFDRSLKQLGTRDKREIKDVAIRLIEGFSGDRQLHHGLGLKRLRGHYWEVRWNLKIRILFRWEGDLIEFVLAGNHNDVKRFLKNN